MPLCVAGSTNLTVVYFRPLTSATVLGFHSMFEFLFWNSISFKEQLSQLPCFSDSHQNIKFNYTNIHNDNSNQNKRIILIHWLFSPARDISVQAVSASFVILRNLGNITMPRHKQGIRGSALVILCLYLAQMVKSFCNAGNRGSIPGSGISPGEGNGNPLQYSCPENPMDWGAWWATVHGVAKRWTRLSN